MKLYGGRVLRNSTSQQIEQRIESRDALLWDVLPAERRARVKIQGSSELIIAHYPENWEATPVWLKRGNAVRISHPGGIRGRIELVGHGSSLPTAIPGDSNIIPAPPLPDAIISGLSLQNFERITTEIFYCSPESITSDHCCTEFIVTVGQVRFNETVYDIGAIFMRATNPMIMGGTGNITLGKVAAFFAPGYLNPCTDITYFRYHLVYITETGLQIAYTTEAASRPPVMPALPGASIQIGTILDWTKCFYFTSGNFNKLYSDMEAASVKLTLSAESLVWGDTAGVIITVGIVDQYGGAITSPTGNWIITISIDSGTGIVANAAGEQSTESVTTLTASDGAGFYYYRNNIAYPTSGYDQSPLLEVRLENNNSVNSAVIQLLDASGSPM